MDDRTVTVWWLAVDKVAEPDWPRLAGLLDDAERARAQRFHFARDQQAYVAAHALGRVLLSSALGGAPQRWRFAVGDHGKPEVEAAAGGGVGSRPRLNLSHTRGLAAAALTLDHDVGIDVEWLDRAPASMDVARRFFAPSECAQLVDLPPERLNPTFLSFWTLKEAYVKAIGKGLAQPLDSFAFTLEPVSIRFDAVLADDPARWLFRRFQPTPGHVAALALRHPEPMSVRVNLAAREVADLVAA